MNGPPAKPPEQAELEQRLSEAVLVKAQALGREAQEAAVRAGAPSAEEVPVEIGKQILEQLGERALLRRHLPLLRYDAQAPWRAESAATITDNPSNVLVREDGDVIARPPELSLDLLAGYPNPLAGDRLVEGAEAFRDIARLRAEPLPPEHTGAGAPQNAWTAPAPDAPRYRDGQEYFPKYADRVYGRAVRESGRTWLQYWLWFYFTPNNLLGFGRHQGGWKLVQVGLNDNGVPVVATYAQRVGEAESRPWRHVERVEHSLRSRPVVYISPFTHACYFESGTHPSRAGVDTAYGDGPDVTPFLELFGPWVMWPGRWGGTASRAALSPRGPATHKAWRSPERYHRDTARVPRRLRRLVHAAGRFLYPRAPRLDVELEPGREKTRAVVSYMIPRVGLRRPQCLYVTIHSADDEEQVLAGRVLRVPGVEAGQTIIALSGHVDECVVRTTAYTRLRFRSDVAQVQAKTSLEAPQR